MELKWQTLYLSMILPSLPSWIRMFDFQWPENLSIFLDNLCIYHICFDLISFFTIIFTWWFCKAANTNSQNNNGTNEADPIEETESSSNISLSQQTLEKEQDSYNVLNWSDENIVSNLKILKQKALVKELQSKLTEDELEEEKKMEKLQLEKIFQLLQDQEDKFQMTSMDQLQDQLHLYRI